jgi:uncharacterized protein YndB with AHSA1/START domain
MAAIEHSVTINRPVETVFAELSNLAGHARWQTGLVEMRQLSDGPLAIGATVLEVRQFLGRRSEARFAVSAYEPNRRLAMRSVGGPFPSEGSYTVEPSDGGTRLTINLAMQPGGFFKLAEPLVARTLKRAVVADFGTLKDLLEG